MSSPYRPVRTDLLGWRLKVGEDNHGQHKWVYLPEGEARDAWPQSKEDKYWLGLDLVNLTHFVPAPVRALRSCFWAGNCFKQS
jgi:hypothetical protein